MTFDETREDLGHGLTRRRPALGEIDYARRDRTWVYECALHLETPVDTEALSFLGTQQYVRSTFAKAMRDAADRLEWGDGGPPS